MQEPTIICKQDPWIIQQGWHPKEKITYWAITKITGRFAMYIRGASEKVPFVLTLERIREDMKTKGSPMFFCFNQHFCCWLTKEDVDLFLGVLKLTEKEKILKEKLAELEGQTAYSYQKGMIH